MNHLQSKYRIATQYIEGGAYIEAELYRYILWIRYIFDSIFLWIDIRFA